MDENADQGIRTVYGCECAHTSPLRRHRSAETDADHPCRLSAVRRCRAAAAAYYFAVSPIAISVEGNQGNTGHPGV